MGISQEILDKYNMGNPERYESPTDFYSTFIQQSNSIIIEAFEEMFSGTSITTLYRNYKEIIEARIFARTQIRQEQQNERIGNNSSNRADR